MELPRGDTPRSPSAAVTIIVDVRVRPPAISNKQICRRRTSGRRRRALLSWMGH